MLRPTLRIFALVLTFTVAPQVFAADQHGIKDPHKVGLVQKDRQNGYHLDHRGGQLDHQGGQHLVEHQDLAKQLRDLVDQRKDHLGKLGYPGTHRADQIKKRKAQIDETQNCAPTCPRSRSYCISTFHGLQPLHCNLIVFTSRGGRMPSGLIQWLQKSLHRQRQSSSYL